MGVCTLLGIFAEVGLWMVYLTFYGVFTTIRNIIWLFNGTYRQIWDSSKPENYATSAQIMKVRARYRVDPFVETRLLDFVTTHEGFVSPEYVFRDDVNLMQITTTEAIFVQQKPGSKPMEEFAFVIVGIHDAPLKVIKMPIESFIKLADSMPENKAKIIFLHNQARCGGTLFTEMFKATRQCITYCEPHVINAVVKWHHIEAKWDHAHYIRMLRLVTKVLCKPRASRPDTLGYVIKPTAMSTICADAVQEAMPDAIQFFIYRDPVTVAASIRRVGEALTSVRLMYNLPNLPNMSSPLMKQNGYCEVDFRGWTPKTGLEMAWGFRIAATTMMRYLRYREKGIRIHGIRYEVLVANKESMTRRILELCRMPKSLVPKAMEAFGRDSQENSPVSRAILKRLAPTPPEATPAFMRRLKRCARR